MSTSRWKGRCTVSTCKKAAGTLGDDGQPILLHVIPSNPKLASAWATRLGNCHTPIKTRVCSLHFQPTDYKRDLQNELLGIPIRKKLNPDAVPSLLLPNNTVSIEQQIQRTARLKEKCERRNRHEYIKQLEEELMPRKEAEEAAAVLQSSPVHVPSSIVVKKQKSTLRTPTPVHSPSTLRVVPLVSQKQHIKDSFRINVLQFINSPTFTNKTDFPTRAQYDHMLMILKQGRAYKNDPYENKILAEFTRFQQNGTGSTKEIILVRKDAPEKRILIADDFVEAVWKSHNDMGHPGCLTTLQTLKEKFVYVPTRLVLDYIKKCLTCATDTDIEGVSSPIVIDDIEDIDVEDPAPTHVSEAEISSSANTNDAHHLHVQLEPTIPVPHENDTAFRCEDEEVTPILQCFICGKSSAYTAKWEGAGKQLCELMEFPFSKSMVTILDNWTSCVPCLEHIKEGVIIMKQLESLGSQLRKNRKKLKKLVQASRSDSKPPSPGFISLSAKFKTLYSALSYSAPPTTKLSTTPLENIMDGKGSRRKQKFKKQEKAEDEVGWDSIICEAEIPAETASTNPTEFVAGRAEFGKSSTYMSSLDATAEEPMDEEIFVLSPPPVEKVRKRRKWTPRYLHLLKCTFDHACPRRFLNQKTMDYHIVLQHLGKKPYRCDYENCGTEFLGKQALRNHVNLRHRNKTSQRSCGICDKIFQENETQEMKEHEDLHKKNIGKDNQYACVVGNCAESFKGSAFLKRHVRCHHEDRPHRCSVCGASFAAKVYLRRHQLTHSEERPHQCEVCGKSYRSISRLGVHRKYHFVPAVPNLPCSECGKMFKMQKYLKRHLRHSCPEVTGRQPNKRGRHKKVRSDETKIQKSIDAAVAAARQHSAGR